MHCNAQLSYDDNATGDGYNDTLFSFLRWLAVHYTKTDRPVGRKPTVK